jgi:mRNA interferase MazF
MKKDFNTWHDKKVVIDTIPKRPFFHEREIWFCHLGANVGFEQDGSGDEFLRPILIVRKFNNEIFWGVPLTKAQKERAETAQAYYFSFSFVPSIRSEAILSQIRLIDGRRLARKIGEIPAEPFDELKKKLKALLP